MAVGCWHNADLVHSTSRRVPPPTQGTFSQTRAAPTAGTTVSHDSLCLLLVVILEPGVENSCSETPSRLQLRLREPPQVGSQGRVSDNIFATSDSQLQGQKPWSLSAISRAGCRTWAATSSSASHHLEGKTEAKPARAGQVPLFTAPAQPVSMQSTSASV